MDHMPSAYRLADVAFELAAHVHDPETLKSILDQLNSDLTVAQAGSPFRRELEAAVAIAEALLRQTVQSRQVVSENAAVLARLDQLKRELDTATQGEWIAAERIRIATDLHDRVAQTLFGLGLTADWLLSSIDHDEHMRADLERLKQMASAGLRQVRESIFALSSGPVEAGQLRLAVGKLLGDLESASITGHFSAFGDLQRLPPEVTDAIYQIIREALVNVRRHAEATNVLVSIRMKPDNVTVVIQDDGKGLQKDVAETYRKGGAHLGLLGMESRAERLGGTFTLQPGDEVGLIVAASIPLKGAGKHV